MFDRIYTSNQTISRVTFSSYFITAIFFKPPPLSRVSRLARFSAPEERKGRALDVPGNQFLSGRGRRQTNETRRTDWRNRPRLSPRLELTRNYAILRSSRQILSTVRVGMRVCRIARGKTLFLTLGYPLIGGIALHENYAKRYPPISSSATFQSCLLRKKVTSAVSSRLFSISIEYL